MRTQGFNRLSLGVQDFDPLVQRAVNRVQPEHLTLDIIKAARAQRYRSVSIDLIYGLPGQNVISMAQTLAKVIQAGPDRISLYNYAHLPHLFKPQRRTSTHWCSVIAASSSTLSPGRNCLHWTNWSCCWA